MAKLVCACGYTAEVLHTPAGYYVGTVDPEEGPQCRCSGYYASKEEAEEALRYRTFDLVCDENIFCNGGWGCFPDLED